jgi:hypothetical protein
MLILSFLNGGAEKYFMRIRANFCGISCSGRCGGKYGMNMYLSVTYTTAGDP